MLADHADLDTQSDLRLSEVVTYGLGLNCLTKVSEVYIAGVLAAKREVVVWRDGQFLRWICMQADLVWQFVITLDF